MKTLFIARHGDAAAGSALAADAQRPLSPRGRLQAGAAGQYLSARQPLPGVILSSSAERARATAAILHEAAPAADLQVRDEFYGADPSLWLRHLAQVAEPTAAVLLVGHNPGLALLVEALTGRAVGFPPAGLAHLHLTIATWSLAALEPTARLVDLWTPGH